MSLQALMTELNTKPAPVLDLEGELHAAIDRIFVYFRLRPVRILLGSKHYHALLDDARAKGGLQAVRMAPDQPPKLRLVFWSGPEGIPVEEDPLREDVAILVDGAQLVAAGKW